MSYPYLYWHSSVLKVINPDPALTLPNCFGKFASPKKNMDPRAFRMCQVCFWQKCILDYFFFFAIRIQKSDGDSMKWPFSFLLVLIFYAFQTFFKLSSVKPGGHLLFLTQRLHHIFWYSHSFLSTSRSFSVIGKGMGQGFWLLPCYEGLPLDSKH